MEKVCIKNGSAMRMRTALRGGGKRTRCVWRMGVCRRCLCKSEENEDRSPKGANMAGAIFVGILDFERGR